MASGAGCHDRGGCSSGVKTCLHGGNSNAPACVSSPVLQLLSDCTTTADGAAVAAHLGWLAGDGSGSQGEPDSSARGRGGHDPVLSDGCGGAEWQMKHLSSRRGLPQKARHRKSVPSAPKPCCRPAAASALTHATVGRRLVQHECQLGASHRDGGDGGCAGGLHVAARSGQAGGEQGGRSHAGG